MKRPLCQHCSTRRVNRPLGLCFSCYYRPGVRQLYGARTIEPTAADLERIETEQRERLPAWWPEESEGARDYFGAKVR